MALQDFKPLLKFITPIWSDFNYKGDLNNCKRLYGSKMLRIENGIISSGIANNSMVIGCS